MRAAALLALLLGVGSISSSAQLGGYYSSSPRPVPSAGSYNGSPRPAPGVGGYYSGSPRPAPGAGSYGQPSRCAGGYPAGSYGGYYGGCTSGGGVLRPNDTTKEPSTPPPVDPCGAESVNFVLAFELFDSAAFETGLPAFTAGLASLVGEPKECISVERDPAAHRRSLLSSEPLTVVVFTIRTDDTATTALLLEGASAELAELLQLLGGRLAFYFVRDFEGNEIFTATLPAAVGAQSAAGAPAPAPAESTPVDPAALADLLDPAVLESMSMTPPASAPAQAPVQSSAALSSAADVPKNKKSSNLGAILGGALGGGLAALALAAAVVVYLRRRSSSGADGSDGLPPAFNPTFEGTTATVTLKGGAPKGVAKFDHVALEEVVESTGTPRSARRRHNTAFNSDAS